MEELDHEEKKLCSNCKRLIPVVSFVLHESHCKRHLKVCEICNEPVPTQEMEEHMLENHAPTSCDQCGASMPRDQLEEHTESLCPERDIDCKYCELEVKARDYDTHVNACGSRTDFCDKCNVRVMLKDMEEHKLAKCGDLKAVEFPTEESTLENLPPSYMDGYAAMNTGGISQGPLIGDEEYFFDQEVLGDLPMPPDFLEGAAMFLRDPPNERPRERRNENVQVDQQWLEEVGEVCEGEDIDRMMAQAIAMEDNRQVTSRDHLFGIEDRVIREGQYASRLRDMEEERGDNDAELARRLQSTFDQEYNRQQTDANLARQLNDQAAVPPPPIDAHHTPHTALPPDYSTIEREQEREEREWPDEQQQEREQAREWERERVRERERERKRQRETDSLFAERLQTEEQDHLKNELERKMESSSAVERDSDDSEPEEVDDVRLALKLQKEEIRQAEERIREFRRKHGLPEGKYSRSEDQKEPDRSRGQWEGDHYRQQETHSFQSKPPELLTGRSFSPSPSPPSLDTAGHQPGYDGMPTLEPYDDSEQPRLKPIPKPRPLEEGEEKVPCQFCKESFPFDVIMDHQRHCTGDYGFSTGRGRGRWPGRGRGKPVDVNLDEVLREEAVDERERTTGGRIVLCKHCQEPFPQTRIDPHQALCDKNPDKELKNAYQSYVTAQNKNPPVSMANTPAVSMPTTHTATEAEDDIMLPCEHCQVRCPPHNLLSHQAVCRLRPHPPNPQQSSRDRDLVSAGSSESIPCQFCGQQIPFQNCIKHEAMCRFQRYPPPPSSTVPSTHLPPHTAPPPPSSTVPSTRVPSHTAPPLPSTRLPSHTAPPPSSSTVPSTRVPSHTAPPLPSSTVPSTRLPSHTAPSTGSQKPLKPSQQKRIAAVFPQAPPNSLSANTATTKTTPSSLTDDQKSTLLSSRPRTTASNNSVGVSTMHPLTAKSSERGILQHSSSQMNRPFSHQPLPRIYMYTSTSQPHSINGTVKEQGGELDAGRSVSVARDTKIQQKVEVVANRLMPHHRKHDVNTGQTSSKTRAPAQDQTPPSATEGTRSVAVTSQPSAPVTSTGVTARVPTTTHNSSPPSQSRRVRSGEPSRVIGTNTTIVRPTPSDFAVLQRQPLVPTPISLPAHSDEMSNPLKLATSGSSLLSNLSLIPPISTAPSSKKAGKTTENKTQHNVHVNSPNTLQDTDKSSMNGMADTLIQKPMVGIDIAVLVPPQVQNTALTSLKDSSSRKDMTLMKGPSKLNQLNLAKLSEGKGKGVLDVIKITPAPPTNLSPEITGSKSFFSGVTGYKDHETTPSPATSTSSIDNPPQFPAPITAKRNTGGELELPFSATDDSYSPSVDGDEGGPCDYESDGSTTLTSTGPLVEITGSYADSPATSPKPEAQGKDGLDGGTAASSTVIPHEDFSWRDSRVAQAHSPPGALHSAQMTKSISHQTTSGQPSTSCGNGRAKPRNGDVITLHHSTTKTSQPPLTQTQKTRTKQTVQSQTQKQTTSVTGPNRGGTVPGKPSSSTPRTNSPFEHTGQRQRGTGGKTSPSYLKQTASHSKPSPKSGPSRSNWKEDPPAVGPQMRTAGLTRKPRKQTSSVEGQ